MGERGLCKPEVGGSIPLCSTKQHRIPVNRANRWPRHNPPPSRNILVLPPCLYHGRAMVWIRRWARYGHHGSFGIRDGVAEQPFWAAARLPPASPAPVGKAPGPAWFASDGPPVSSKGPGPSRPERTCPPVRTCYINFWNGPLQDELPIQPPTAVPGIISFPISLS